MEFENLIKKGIVRKTSVDVGLIRSLINTAEQDLNYLKCVKINKISARKTFSNYYDVLRSLLEAIASQKGYKIYSHEAFSYFLKKENKNVLAKKFDRLRKIRNAVNYYGKEISPEYAGENIQEIKKIILKLKEIYKLK